MSEFLNEEDNNCHYLGFSLDGENNVDLIDGSNPKKNLFNGKFNADDCY